MGNLFPNQTLNSNRSVLYKVFGWMFAGLLVSALTAYWVAGSPAAQNAILGNQTAFFGIIILELVAVVALGWMINKISASAAVVLFLLYSFLNGLTLSVIVLEFSDASLASTFMIAAVMFGVMAVYGYTTGRDLSRMGSILFMGLIGLIIAALVNIFVGNTVLELAISAAGVIIFTGLTAYDLQKIKNMEANAADDATRNKFAIFGALILYLDFINIFLSLLNFTGRRRK
jgi:uncharacterized protein